MMTLRNRKLLKAIEACNEHMKFNTCYNEALKDAFRLAARSFLNELREKLTARMPIKAYAITYNPGGIAVSGDSKAFYMTTSNHGVCVFFNADGVCPYITYRLVNSIHDHTGGKNEHLELKNLDVDVLTNKILELFQRGTL